MEEHALEYRIEVKYLKSVRDPATIFYNEAAALVDAAHKDIQVLIDLHEPPTKREAQNEVSEDTLETLSESEVDAEGEVFRDTAETPELEGTTLLLPAPNPQAPYKERGQKQSVWGNKVVFSKSRNGKLTSEEMSKVITRI